eukprot:Selendium_serpulae@DN6464_c1_g1_i12.p2
MKVSPHKWLAFSSLGMLQFGGQRSRQSVSHNRCLCLHTAMRPKLIWPTYIFILQLKILSELFTTSPLNSPPPFLRSAHASNTSDFPFLPSRRAAVLVDGSHTATTEMPAVQPGEEFQIFLGVDHNIKVAS